MAKARPLKRKGRPLEVVYVPIDSLHPNPWNPNRQNERVARATRESLDQYGFVDGIVVRPHPERAGEWQIIGGEHRVKEARALGETEVPIMAQDLDDVAAKKLTIILNQGGEADVALLGNLLADLQAATDPSEFLRGLAFSASEVDHLTALADVDWDDYKPKTIAPDDEGTDERHVGLVYSEDDYQRFDTFSQMLSREWGIDVPAAVLQAVENAAKGL